jgi:TRAP-type C4-dicarboxylate transport system permease small subunit
MASTFQRGLEFVESALNLLSTAILFFLLLYVNAEVVMRFVFNNPLPGHLELSQLLIAAAVFLGLAYAQARRSHVGIDILIKALPPGPALVVDTITLALSLAAVAVVVWYSWDSALHALAINDITPTAELPTWWSKIALPIGGAVLCVRFLVQMIENLTRLATGRLVHPVAGHHGASEEAIGEI